MRKPRCKTCLYQRCGAGGWATKTLNLKQLLNAVRYRREVVTRRTIYEFSVKRTGAYFGRAGSGAVQYRPGYRID